MWTADGVQKWVTSIGAVVAAGASLWTLWRAHRSKSDDIRVEFGPMDPPLKHRIKPQRDFVASFIRQTTVPMVFYSAWMQGAVESDIDAIKRAMRLDSVAIQANTKPKAVAQKSKRVDSTVIRTASRPSDEAEIATYSAFGTGFGTGFVTSKEVPQPKSLTRNEKKWRRGWDSNPRAGITRPSDFESAPL
jgi:hypothetical protein